MGKRCGKVANNGIIGQQTRLKMNKLSTKNETLSETFILPSKGRLYGAKLMTNGSKLSRIDEKLPHFRHFSLNFDIYFA